MYVCVCVYINTNTYIGLTRETNHVGVKGALQLLSNRSK